MYVCVCVSDNVFGVFKEENETSLTATKINNEYNVDIFQNSPFCISQEHLKLVF